MERITLEYPVEYKGQKLETLNMRRPKVRDQIAVQSAGTDVEQELRLFANLCEVSPEVLEGMDLKDYTKLQEVYRDFLS
ncbi:phage tail assembly protein [Desulfobaculum sp. SPO524]|uniref:phage tail assembly protein n=1 Tax=Desulfobaculum sp. SPO524 TaxID=3378071 RepID=UPI0038520B34